MSLLLALTGGGGGPVTHSAIGALTGPSSTISGAAERSRIHDASGILSGTGSLVAGAASRTRVFASSGVLVGPGSAVSGSSNRYRAFSSTGALVGQGSAISGSAARVGAAITHSATGVLTGPGSAIVGSAARNHIFAASGALVAGGSTITGSSARTGATVSHDATGSLVASGSQLSGTASKPIVGGGGPGNTVHKKKRGWANERAQFELSHEVIKAKQVFEESTDETIQAIVEQIDDYTHEREQFEALQIEFALLQSRLYNDSSYSADLRQAALTLQEFIQDEQDAIDLLMLMEDFDARCVITATTQPFKVVS